MKTEVQQILSKTFMPEIGQKKKLGNPRKLKNTENEKCISGPISYVL